MAHELGPFGSIYEGEHWFLWSVGMMNTQGRIFAAFCLLVVVWITIYWMYDPAEPAGITFDQTSSGLGEEFPGEESGFVTEPAAVEQDDPLVAGLDGPAQNPEDKHVSVGIVEPEFKDYVIQNGDTFESIARREFGSTTFASRIAKSNPFKDPMRLRAGQVIRIPLDPDNIQGQLVDSGQIAPRGTPQNTEIADQTVEYVIKKGDTLSEIAEAFYGSTRYVEFIFETNRERLGLKAQSEIRIGQMLLLPPNPPSE